MITGVTIKHFAYCPQIVKLESMGFEERVTEAMREGEGMIKRK
jgi:CRISPR-associated exonuclease Cas4